MAEAFSTPGPKGLLDGELHKRILEEISGTELKIYVVGGYLRDLILADFNPSKKYISKDLDYAICGGSAFSFAKKMASLLGGHFVSLDETNDTARIVMPEGTTLDFAGCQGSTIEQDVLRRDFTANALYLDPNNEGVILDRVGGIDDIKNGTVRAVSSGSFTSDPLRLLRAFRFAASWDFKIEEQTLHWIQDSAELISTVAGERISAELFTIFALPSTKAVMSLLAETGLLEAIFSELKTTRSVTNNSHHHLNLFDHSLETVLKSEDQYISNTSWDSTNLQEDISFAISRLSACKIAALLHDIGKPATWVITEEGKHTFIAHDKIGADMIADIADRLRWSKPVEKFITKLVRFHLRPGQLFHQNQPSKQAVNRLFRQTGTDFPALILLALGDLGATQGPAMIGEKSTALRKNFYWLLSEFYEFSAVVESMEKLLDGNDVMRLLNLQPGQEIGHILEALREAQEFKKVLNREQAEEFVLSFQKKNGLSRD
jgi:putative nucleotidyltransferase with HDIG domain